MPVTIDSEEDFFKNFFIRVGGNGFDKNHYTKVVIPLLFPNIFEGKKLKQYINLSNNDKYIFLLNRLKSLTVATGGGNEEITEDLRIKFVSLKFKINKNSHVFGGNSSEIESIELAYLPKKIGNSKVHSSQCQWSILLNYGNTDGCHDQMVSFEYLKSLIHPDYKECFDTYFQPEAWVKERYLKLLSRICKSTDLYIDFYKKLEPSLQNAFIIKTRKSVPEFEKWFNTRLTIASETSKSCQESINNPIFWSGNKNPDNGKNVDTLDRYYGNVDAIKAKQGRQAITNRDRLRKYSHNDDAEQKQDKQNKTDNTKLIAKTIDTNEFTGINSTEVNIDDIQSLFTELGI